MQQLLCYNSIAAKCLLSSTAAIIIKDGGIFVKTLRQTANAIILCIIEAAAGILLLIHPVGFTSTVIIVAGIALMLDGLLNIINYFRSNPADGAAGQLLMRGRICILAGAFCAFNSGWFLVTFPVITVLYGVAVLVGGMGKIQAAMDMRRMGNNKWWWALISAVISIVCAMVIINNPFSSTMAIWLFTGISLIAEAIVDVIALVVSRGK